MMNNRTAAGDHFCANHPFVFFEAGIDDEILIFHGPLGRYDEWAIRIEIT